MDHQPFFTVIITTYNRSALLPRALKSLVSQTEKDWEAIIVDDGSTDNTYSHIKDWLNTGSGIIYLRKDHGGVVSAKNHGIKVANGNSLLSWIPMMNTGQITLKKERNTSCRSPIQASFTAGCK
jgi:glycosyltransferase involved in cell wall biosynthesis